METSEIFKYVIVGAILVAAAVPLIGVIFSSGKPKGLKEAKTGKKRNTPQPEEFVA